MTTVEISEPGKGLSFTGHMPLSWKQLDADAREYEEAAVRARNGRLFQLLLLYDEYPAERRDEEGEHTGELERLEAKLDAVIQLLAFLIAERNRPAEKRPVTVTAHHLAWVERSGVSPVAGERLRILLEIDPRLPQPLELTARVVRLEPAGNGAVRVQAALEDQGERVQEALEKLIFRIHRREIARMRSGKGER
ncbi:MAG: PilZ domain-containing protein [Gammaproteobacteria bacterium]|nr:PilZ domain-containing protein [Gammaproteobacteria bacterium]